MALLNVKGLILGKKPRKDGRFMGRWLMDGKYHPFYAKTYPELQAEALKIVTGKRRFDKQGQMTYKDWAEKWLELYHKKKVSEQVFKNDYGIFKNHIYPYLEKKLLHRLTAFEVQETINACPYSRQRQIVANLLTASLRKAYETDVLKKDIIKAVEKPSHEVEGGRPLSHTEEKNLLKYLKGHELENYIIFLLNSGLRRNEALGLQWKHLDFDKNEIIVDQQVDMENNFTRTLKTKMSRRIVKMFPEIKKRFQNLKTDPEKRLFEFMPNYVTQTFKDICKELNLQNYSIKSNRTTFATRCAEKGIANKVVQAWLGHSKLDTTVNNYQKAHNDFIEQEFKKLFDTDSDTDLN